MRGTWTLLTLALMAEFGCGGQTLDASAEAPAWTSDTGGSLALGGSHSANDGLGGTQPMISGNSSTAGAPSTGGFAATGGSSAIVCPAPVVTREDNCGVASNATGNFDRGDNRVSLGDYGGYGYVYISPAATGTGNQDCDYSVPESTCTLACNASAFGNSWTALCGAGTVPADCTLNACAGIGFNLKFNPETVKAHPSPVPPRSVR